MIPATLVGTYWGRFSYSKLVIFCCNGLSTKLNPQLPVIGQCLMDWSFFWSAYRGASICARVQPVLCKMELDNARMVKRACPSYELVLHLPNLGAVFNIKLKTYCWYKWVWKISLQVADKLNAKAGHRTKNKSCLTLYTNLLISFAKLFRFKNCCSTTTTVWLHDSC